MVEDTVTTSSETHTLGPQSKMYTTVLNTILVQQ